MPPRRAGPNRKAGKRKAGGRVAGAVASSVLARGACGDLEDKHQEHVQHVEDIIDGLKDKSELRRGSRAVDQSSSGRLLAPRVVL